MNSEVTVITASYNSQKYLRETVESVASQTLMPKEHLIIDDCSTDDSLTLAKQLEQEYSHIRVIEHEQNKGFPAALNTGIAASVTKFVAILDSDDVAFPNWLSELMPYIMNDESICAVGCGGKKMTESGVKTGSLHFGERDDTRIERGIAPFSHPGTVWRKAIFNKYGLYDTRMQGWEDAEIFTRIAPYCKLMHCNKALFFYRIRPSSLYAQGQHLAPLIRSTILKRYQLQKTGKTLAEAHKEVKHLFDDLRKQYDSKKIPNLKGGYEYKIGWEFESSGHHNFKAAQFYILSAVKGYSKPLALKGAIRALLPKKIKHLIKKTLKNNY